MNTNINSAKPWTDEELKASVLSYFEMQTKEKCRVVYTKKYYYCILSIVFDRSEKAFEFRMQNISYILSSMGKEWLSGLKPARNVGANISASINRIIQSLTSSGLTVTKKPIFDNRSIWICQQREVAALKHEIAKLDARIKLRSVIKVGEGEVYKDPVVEDYLPPITDECIRNKERFKKSILSFQYFTQILESQKERASFSEPTVKQLLESLQRRNGILNKFTQTIYYKNYPRQEEYLFELWKEKKELSELLSKYEDSEDSVLPIPSSSKLRRQITRTAIASRKIVYDEISKEKKSIDTEIIGERVSESHDEARIFGLPIARWEKLILEAELFWYEIELLRFLPSKKSHLKKVFSEKVDGLRQAIHNYAPSKTLAEDEVFQAFSELKKQMQSAIGLRKRYSKQDDCSTSDEMIISKKNELFRNVWFCIKNTRHEYIDLHIKEIEQIRLTQTRNNANNLGFNIQGKVESEIRESITFTKDKAFQIENPQRTIKSDVHKKTNYVFTDNEELLEKKQDHNSKHSYQDREKQPLLQTLTSKTRVYPGERNRSSVALEDRVAMADAAFSVLKSRGGSMHYVALYMEVVRDSGNKYDSSTMLSLLSNSLSAEMAMGKSRFVYKGKGIWTICLIGENEKDSLDSYNRSRSLHQKDAPHHNRINATSEVSSSELPVTSDQLMRSLGIDIDD